MIQIQVPVLKPLYVAAAVWDEALYDGIEGVELSASVWLEADGPRLVLLDVDTPKENPPEGDGDTTTPEAADPLDPADDEPCPLPEEDRVPVTSEA